MKRDFPTARLLPAVTIALLGSPLAAQDSCPTDVTLDDLAGSYTLEIGDALLSGGNRTIALDASDSIPVTMDVRGGSLYMAAGPDVVIIFDLEADPGSSVDRGRFSAVAGISASDLELTMGCDLEDLPVLVGGGLSNSMEGTPIEFEYTFLVLDDDWMVGTLDWAGGGISSTRLAMLTGR